MANLETPITVITKNPDIEPGRLLITPPGQPNIIFQYADPLIGIFIRSFRTFTQTMLGVLSVGGVGKVVGMNSLIPFHDFNQLLLVAASASFGAAVISFGQNLIELLANLEKKYPILMG